MTRLDRNHSLIRIDKIVIIIGGLGYSYLVAASSNSCSFSRLALCCALSYCCPPPHPPRLFVTNPTLVFYFIFPSLWAGVNILFSLILIMITRLLTSLIMETSKEINIGPIA
ncbi:hypothetical protein BDL97_14G030000 [Sphagnum fallax]|nr:hypothetical protein BDL97_14G030000 [Sphagnum fallax]